MFFSIFLFLLWLAGTIGVGRLTFIKFEEAYDFVDYLMAWGLLIVMIASVSLMFATLVEAVPSA
jgi:hypothetical protein